MDDSVTILGVWLGDHVVAWRMQHWALRNPFLFEAEHLIYLVTAQPDLDDLLCC